ncbi:MAG: carbohydrate kinase [Chromatiales bacterium]|jgi:gluconokinase|nr:carbohydrate kinase [Chromatiales bacterium]
MTKVLAIDIGTSSVRTAVLDQRGRRWRDSTARRAVTLETDVTGRAEIAPNKLLGALRTCLNETHRWLDEHDQMVAAVGVACFWHSALGVDAANRPVTPIITWADSRAAGEIDAMAGMLSPVHYHALTGCMLHASFWPARMRWWRHHRRADFARVNRWLSPADWLLSRLVGTRNTAHGMASATGLYNQNTRDWADVLLGLCHLRREQLLPISDEGTITPARVARQWPRFAGAIWYPAIGDGAAGNLGSGAVSSDTLALNYGTSAALRVLRRTRSVAPPYGLFAYRVDPHRFVLGGATSNAGIIRQWALDTLRVPLQGDALDRWIAKRPPGHHGLTLLPFLNGERAPYWRDDLSATVRGLRISTTPLDFVSALTEATYHRLALIAAQIPGAKRRVAIVSGGLARSPAAARMLADVTGLKVRACLETEATLRGAGVLALERLGHTPPAPTLGPLVAPDPARSRAFARLRREHMTLEERLT